MLSSISHRPAPRPAPRPRRLSPRAQSARCRRCATPTNVLSRPTMSPRCATSRGHHGASFIAPRGKLFCDHYKRGLLPPRGEFFPHGAIELTPRGEFSRHNGASYLTTTERVFSPPRGEFSHHHGVCARGRRIWSASYANRSLNVLQNVTCVFSN